MYIKNSNLDTIGPEESVLISEVSYTNMVLGEEESVLFREVSLFQGYSYRRNLLYVCVLYSTDMVIVVAPYTTTSLSYSQETILNITIYTHVHLYIHCIRICTWSIFIGRGICTVQVCIHT